MTAPRIGDTIHYTDRAWRGHCYAAIITNVLDASYTLSAPFPGATGHVHLVDFEAPTGGVRQHMNIPMDPNEMTDGDGAPYIPMAERTPGTWHHIH